MIGNRDGSYNCKEGRNLKRWKHLKGSRLRRTIEDKGMLEEEELEEVDYLWLKRKFNGYMQAWGIF